MNRTPNRQRTRGRRLLRPFVVTCGLAAGFNLAGAATNPVEANTHTLFMGADFDIQQDQGLYRVLDVSESCFIIKKNDALVKVPMNGAHVSMRIKQELKLTDVTATIADLQKDRAYTKQTDPEGKFMREASNFSGASAVQDIANVKLDYWNSAQKFAQSPAGQLSPNAKPQPQLAAFNGEIVRGGLDVANAASESHSTLNDPGHQAGMMQDELNQGLFDAMHVSFLVASPKPLRNPYLVLIVQYRESTEKPGTAHNWIYASELDPIDEQPHLVSILRGGLPPGFVLEDFQLHLYNRGYEVATTASDRKVPLTRQEAFDYVLINFLGTHKGGTLSAAPAMGRISAEARAELAAGQYTQPFYVKVNKDGAPVKGYLDEACTQEVDDSRVNALIGTVRFTPALDHGKPVDGTAKLKFSELSI